MVKSKYAWAASFRRATLVKPDDFAAVLKRLKVDLGREVTPHDVLFEALDPASTIFGLVELDETEAAYSHRVHQIRTAINSLRVRVVLDEGTEVLQRAYAGTDLKVSLITPTGRKTTQTTYEPLADLLRDSARRRFVLRGARSMLLAAHLRLQELAELTDTERYSPYSESIDELLELLEVDLQEIHEAT
jgi:hypothetical protein